MRNVYFWGLALAAWVIGMSWWISNTCCLGSFVPPTLSILNDGGKLISQSPSNIQFSTMGMVPVLADDTKTALDSLAGYLKTNPEKGVTLTGYFNTEEAAGTGGGVQLGLGRAAAVQTYLLSQGALADQILPLSMLNDTLVQNGKDLYGAVGFFVGSKPLKGFTVVDGKEFESSTGTADFVFKDNVQQYLNPLSEKVQKTMRQTAEYLVANPSRGLTINGGYYKEEKNNSILPTLGLARAQIVKQLLVKFGVPGNQITTADRLVNRQARTYTMGENGKVLRGLMAFEFSGIKAPEKDRLTEIEERLKGKPIELYFETNSFEIPLSAKQRKDFSDIIYYLENKKGASLGITGHTDDRGARKLNMRLSRKRAEFVAEYLSKNGISAQKMKSSFFGPDKPIADNETREGRAKNRRVSVILN